MRLVEYTAPDGYKRLAWLRDRDPDEDAVAYGIPVGPPLLDDLNLDADQARALWNALIERRLLAWQNSTAFKKGLNEAVRAAKLDTEQAAALYKLYANGPAPKPAPAFDLRTALEDLPFPDRQRACIAQTFAQAGIRCLADVENAPTRVGHICGLDIYQIVAYLLGKSP